jgi:hypothetical protein
VNITRRAFVAAPGVLALPIPSTPEPPVDHRYSPERWQTSICFPDDPYKTIVSDRGELLYGHNGGALDHFATIVEFGLKNDNDGRYTQSGKGILEGSRTSGDARERMLAFATNRPGEGRVDNVVLEVTPEGGAGSFRVSPRMIIRTRQALASSKTDRSTAITAGPDKKVVCVANLPLSQHDTGNSWVYEGPALPVAAKRPARCLFRFPQEGQPAESLAAGLSDLEALERWAQDYWAAWKPFGGDVHWKMPPVYNQFLLSCTRNIQQAREVRDGKLTFQVGPTVYRGLWVVDGNFLLESARYLGFDAEAQQGLETTWGKQQASGAIFATPGLDQHWKDTAIAMFTMVRAAELSQDWTYLERMQPDLMRGVQFLERKRKEGRSEDSANGRYGILPQGFGDGGLRFGPELTNTVWCLAGLRAVADAARDRQLAGLAPVQPFYADLRKSFFAAAEQEMRQHPAGFQYLPMLMKEDPSWNAPDEWDRPRPQTGQWALSHAIYPGLVFERNHPIVRGHVALMSACTKEDVPIETGWLPHEGLWTYNAPFAAHAELWAGNSGLAARHFRGFLRHSSPTLCWREEQPVRGSHVAGYVGDMPHNWASAECVLYLRHMLALEDGPSLRLLAGIGDFELAWREPFELRNTPTRFGRINLKLEPLASGWQLTYERLDGPGQPHIVLPEHLGSRLKAQAQVATAERRWTAVWK